MTVSLPNPGDPITEIDDLISVNDDLFRRVSAIETSLNFIPNGSFEKDSDNDGSPDKWLVRSYDSGSFGLVTVSGDGGKAFYARSAGGGSRGGARIESQDFIPSMPFCIYSLRWLLRSVPFNLMHRAFVTFYRDNRSVLSSQIIYDSADNPVTFECRGAKFITPANTRWVKLFFDLGLPGGPAGHQYIDRVEFFTPNYFTKQKVFATPGEYDFQVPDDRSSAMIFAVAGGGAGGSGNTLEISATVTATINFRTYYRKWDLHYGGGGGGGGALMHGIASVSPGETIPIRVGAGGQGAVAQNGGDGESSFFGDHIVALGGQGGACNQTADHAPFSRGGAGGEALTVNNGTVIGVSGVAGSSGTRRDVKATGGMTNVEWYYSAFGGKGGHTPFWHQSFLSEGGSPGLFLYPGLTGQVYELSILRQRISWPPSATGYGSGGGGGTISYPSGGFGGGNGAGGVIIVRY